MRLLGARQAGKADRHYTTPVPGRKHQTRAATHSPTALQGQGGLGQSWGAPRDTGRHQGTGLQGKGWRVLC